MCMEQRRSYTSVLQEGRVGAPVDKVGKSKKAIPFGSIGSFAHFKMISRFMSLFDLMFSISCLTEIMFSEAIERAKQIDAEFQRSRTPIGNLHGLPLSVKDHFNYQGKDTTIGFVSWAHNPAEEHASVVDRLMGEGAIVIAKSNIPQSMLAWESNNPVWGWTANAWNANLTCGGSSGGEGTLVALRGSPVGAGSDIGELNRNNNAFSCWKGFMLVSLFLLGGSIRMPSAFAGLYGLKPSSGRVPAVGAPAPDEGQHAVPGVFGPLGHSVEDLRLWMDVVVGTEGSSSANLDDREVFWRKSGFVFQLDLIFLLFLR